MLRSDISLEAEVAAEMAADLHCRGTQIGIAVKNGIVRLTGSVTDPALRQAAICAAKRVFGVDGVECRVDVAAADASRPQLVFGQEAAH